ncbi:MAG: peptidoglycan-binding protein [Clostridiales bacterium]|nr:peptidoglycan-binding protein [Clostridiales bacterium]
MTKAKKKKIPRTRIILIAAGSAIAVGLCLGVYFAIKPLIRNEQRPAPRTESVTETPTVTETPAAAMHVLPSPAPQFGEPPEIEHADFPLREGSRGEEVLIAQARLIELHYLEADEPRPVYSSAMGDAVRAFRRQNGMPEDRLLTEVAYNRLIAADAKPYAISKGEQGEEVRCLQVRLYELGYLRQAYITGRFDDETEAATRIFQKNHKMTESGRADRETLRKVYEGNLVTLSFHAGDKGDAVKTAQARLVALQYLPKAYIPKGEMDEETVSALRRAQAANGLLTDGFLNEDILECLTRANAEKFGIRVGMRGDDVGLVQERLRELGYIYYAQITGIYGTNTQTAVTSFQKTNGLHARGVVNRETWDRLFSDQARKALEPIEEEAPEKAENPEEKLFGADKFLQAAQSKIGCSYIRGAKGPNAFDCSGFVYWCMQQAGETRRYMTSKNWSETALYMKIESLDDVLPGDVLVFSGEGEGLGHVGIYAGEGCMIDASSAMGRVRIKRLADDSYWTYHFICAFRIWT